MEQSERDNQTNRRLRRVVGLVVIGAAFSLALAVLLIAAGPLPHLVYLTAAGLILGANLLITRIRIRASQHAVSSTSGALLLLVAFVPAEYVVASMALGILGAKLIQRVSPLKTAFNVGKETLGAAAAVVAAAAVGFTPIPIEGGEVPDFGLLVTALAAAAVAYAVIDEGLASLVVAIASGTTFRQRATAHWVLRLVTRVANVAIVLFALVAYNINPWLIAVVPPLMLAIHFWSANRLRSAVEREAWQQLAQATDEFNVVDLDSVLHAAVRRAAEQFSADWAEVEIWLPDAPRRLVRGDVTEIYFDGPPTDAPASDVQRIPIALSSYRGDAEIGELRLRFHGDVMLSQREHYTLHTFAAALCTAVRNASTFAETQRLADSHARAAAQDPLTQLANRRRLHEYATQMLDARPGRGVSALLLIDLNHFKEVNDTLGHSAGDRVLVEVGHRLAGAVQPGDLVARLGGDEFAVLFVDLPAPAVAVARAQTVLAALAPPLDLDGMRIGIEASGGVAIAPSSGDVDELLRRADVAMYHAKRDGQRVVMYSRTRDTADVNALTLGGDLARAVAEQQFTVNFQPIVDLGTGEAIAAEALARWHHPDRGDLPPDRFLDAIERSGQLAAFAEAVLDQALVAAREWAEAGFPLAVAVNVSPRSLLDPKFPDMVAGRLQARGVPAETLVIELTESVTLSQLEVVDEVLRALRELGVRLALDDFGTGFSSLATLARVPVYELKIDRGFVAAMEQTTRHDDVSGLPAANAVVRSTIELGRSLDLLVVAEGVEREDQRRQLWELGCPTGQGHLFARPMPAHRLLAALQRGHGGRPGMLAQALHEAGSVIRLPASRRRGTAHRLAE